MITVASILDDSAVLLFDRGKQTYTNDVLLPYLRRAYATLERKLILINSNRLVKISDDISIDSNKLDITNRIDSKVDDLIRPIDVYIYDQSIMRYVRVTDFSTLDTEDIIENLSNEVIVWEWQAGFLTFNKDMTDYRIKVKYYAMLDRPPADLKFAAYEDYLIKQTAGLAAEYEMENPTRAGALYGQAILAWDEIKGAEIKENQGKSTRRPSFRRRRWRTGGNFAIRP